MEHKDPSKIVSESKKVPLRIYLDFDGTLTRSDGQSAFDNPIFKLLEKYHFNPAKIKEVFDGGQSDAVLNNYIDDLNELDIFLERSELKEYLQAAPFKLGITAEAVAFLNAMIKQNAEIIIISRNYKEYIDGLLQYYGFKDNIEIHHRVELTNLYNRSKEEAVKSIEASKPPAAYIYIADDDKGDANAMNEGVKQAARGAEIRLSEPGIPPFNTSGAPGRTDEEFLTKGLKTVALLATSPAGVTGEPTPDDDLKSRTEERRGPGLR